MTIVSIETIVVSVEIIKNTEPFVSGLEAHLGYWLRRISNHVSGAFAQALQVRHTSVAEWVVMRQAYEREETTPSELAEAVRMTRGAVSKIVDKLEAKKWIMGKASAADNRVQLLSLTRQGRRALPELAEIADHNDEAFFRCLDARERETLARLLRKLAEFHQIRDVPVE